jgi:hypothetical protein
MINMNMIGSRSLLVSDYDLDVISDYYQNGLSAQHLSEMFNCSPETMRLFLKQSGVAMTSSHVEFFINSVSPEVYAYLAGVLAGDAWIEREKSFTLQCTDADFAHRVFENLNKVGDAKLKLNYYRPRLPHHKFKHYVSLHRKAFIRDIRRLKFVNMERFSKINFINGFIDSEAGVVCDFRRRCFAVNIYNTNLNLLMDISEFLFDNGIGFHIYERKRIKPNHSRCFYISVTNVTDLLEFSRTFNFSIERKQRRLDMIIKKFSGAGIGVGMLEGIGEGLQKSSKKKRWY